MAEGSAEAAEEHRPPAEEAAFRQSREFWGLHSALGHLSFESLGFVAEGHL